MSYEPRTPPSDPAELSAWLMQELVLLKQGLEDAQETIRMMVRHVAPNKIATGQIAYADGTDWDPGQGAGLYARVGSSWRSMTNWATTTNGVSYGSGIKVGPGTASIPTVSGAGVVFANGSTGAGEFIGTTDAADGSAVVVANFLGRGGASANAVIGRIQIATQGTTATNRGGWIIFATKPNGGSLTNAGAVNQAGNWGFGTISPNAAAIAEFASTTKGVLLPRMTTAQRDAISSPTAGLVIYNTSTGKLNFYAAAAWEAVTST
jgi:hypothetical protein